MGNIRSQPHLGPNARKEQSPFLFLGRWQIEQNKTGPEGRKKKRSNLTRPLPDEIDLLSKPANTHTTKNTGSGKWKQSRIRPNPTRAA